jgi:hypothetical protein
MEPADTVSSRLSYTTCLLIFSDKLAYFGRFFSCPTLYTGTTCLLIFFDKLAYFGRFFSVQHYLSIGQPIFLADMIETYF